jgi:hypothetical protein
MTFQDLAAGMSFLGVTTRLVVDELVRVLCGIEQGEDTLKMIIEVEERMIVRLTMNYRLGSQDYG